LYQMPWVCVQTLTVSVVLMAKMTQGETDGKISTMVG